MSDERNTGDEWNITRDPDRIRKWGEQRDMRPYRRRDGGSDDVGFYRHDDAPEDHEQVEWERLGETMTDDELVFIYRDEGEEYELVRRADAAERAAIESEAVEEALMEGESVTTEITETTVVETEVVETDVLESEVVDSELIASDVLESEVVDREVVDTTFVDDETVEVEVIETRDETRERFERKVVESEVVDSELMQGEAVETDEIETSVDVENVQRNLLKSDIVASGRVGEEVVDTDAIESRLLEGDVIETTFVERSTVEEEVADERRLTYSLVDDEHLGTETIYSEELEHDVVSESAVPEHARRRPGDPAEATAPADAVPGDRAAGGPTGVELTEDDVGKRVVDDRGTEVGVVAGVEPGAVLVNPQAGIADRIKTRLGWGGEEDAYAVDEDQVARVDDDEVVLRSV
ncbi:hypothetical protein [Halostella litorea]|uniref:hypothetical protein n=1 Tax=Halostella litorea TaxID=2528831 RepID=UPI001092E5DE|nr:hypothetical protein [Halostella litorea]